MTILSRREYVEVTYLAINCLCIILFDSHEVVRDFETSSTDLSSWGTDMQLNIILRRANLSFCCVIYFYVILPCGVPSELSLLLFLMRALSYFTDSTVYFCCLVMLAHAQCRPGRPAHHTDAHMRRRRTHAQKHWQSCSLFLLLAGLVAWWYWRMRGTQMTTDVRTYAHTYNRVVCRAEYLS